MPRQKPNIVLDWFNVSYRSVVLFLLVVLVAAGGAAAYWLYFAPSGPKIEAQEAIARAETRLGEAAALDADDRVQEIRVAASRVLEEARERFADSLFDDARIAAIRSENLSQKAIDLARGDEAAGNRVRFYRLEGDVRVKRAGEFSWDSADPKMTLGTGDQVKTSSNASVQLIYFDGTITTVQPGSLLEIRELYEDPATNVRKVSEKLNWGEITASTQQRNVEGSFHEVSTETTSARTEEAGEFRVAFDQEEKVALYDVFEGRIEVGSDRRRESVGAGERIKATRDGRLTAKEVLPGVPRLITPSDQRVFVYDDPSQATTTLSWEKVPGAARYRLMISDKFLFTDPLYDAERAETSVVIDGIEPSTYFWKVSAISPSGVQGKYSEVRGFRVTSHKIRDRQDTTPPKLEITDSVQTGPMLIINGRTEPGALLWIDNEKVDVYDDGSFYAVIRLRREGINALTVVAQDSAGNEERQVVKAYVDSY